MPRKERPQAERQPLTAEQRSEIVRRGWEKRRAKLNPKPKPPPPERRPCKCGCGRLVRGTWAAGHHLRGRGGRINIATGSATKPEAEQVEQPPVTARCARCNWTKNVEATKASQAFKTHVCTA